MALLHSLIAASVALLASWTLAVHACMVLGAPVWASIVPLALAMAALHWLVRPDWRGAWRASAASGERRFLAGLLAIALGFAAASLVLDVPTADDFNFFHRALAQLSALGGPFLLGDTAFNEGPLAAISPLHALTTWELGVAIAADRVGLDPLGAYHNATVVALNVLLASTYALLLRELGLGRRAGLVGVLAVFAFLLVDDPRLRSFGLAYRTLWVGKSTQWALLFPMLTLFALRFARAASTEERIASGTLAACACSSAIGLSGTGVFLAPGLLGCAAIAGWAHHRFDRRRLVPFVLLPLAALHPVVVGLLLVIGVLVQPEDLSAWKDGFPSGWGDNLLIALGSLRGAARAFVLALVVPALVLSGSERRFVVGLSLALLAFFANPWVGEGWMALVQPGSYWRVLFLFPIPLGVGLAAGGLVEGAHAATGPAASRRLAALLALGAIALVAWLPAPEARRMPTPLRTKAPLAWRLPEAEARFVSEAAAYLEGRSLLAGPPLSWVAPLVVRGLRVEAARHRDTLHVFANAGRPEEGRRRIAAWEWARECAGFPLGAQAAAESLRSGRVDALVFPTCPPGASGERERRVLLEQLPARWREVHRGHGYRLWLREGPREAAG